MKTNRFIPVLTGNSHKDGLKSYQYPVYPRAYGEQCAELADLTANNGLSPCLRGTD